jgi:NAD(P)-dependent dehydrogenase (short-subunit alcohol dehydrogenase family)
LFEPMLGVPPGDRTKDLAMNKLWFVTGAGGGLGAAIATAALRNGDEVVATDLNLETVSERFAEFGDRVLPLRLDVTIEQESQAAAAAAVQRFGRIDVLVNNAGYGHFGIFEETEDTDAQRQFGVNLFGLLNVTRSVLPTMRKQRSGRIFNLSALGGFIGYPNLSLYSASKFAVEGFSESLALELARFGIQVTIVAPGFMRTNFLDQRSLRQAPHRIPDYAEAATAMGRFVAENNHRQTGDPDRLGGALVRFASLERAPLRFLAGADAYAEANAKLEKMQIEFAEWADLSASIDGAARGEA